MQVVEKFSRLETAGNIPHYTIWQKKNIYKKMTTIDFD